jgi:Tetratricopeptide repeat/Cytochrome c554 and c-prime
MLNRTGFLILSALTVTAVYLAAWPAPNLVYAAVVLAHVGLGVLFALAAFRWIPRVMSATSLERVGGIFLILGTLVGLILIATGTTRSFHSLYLLHIVTTVIAVSILVAVWIGRNRPARAGFGTVVATLLIASLISAASVYMRRSWSKQYAINNPSVAPLSMDGEGDGPNGAFFPSSAQVAGKRKIPAKFFMESDACARCHQDIYNQWNSSAHHFSSFNNQWYRKSIEYMQDVKGTKPSKWCGGCHDPAVLYSGLMDTPIKQVVNRPESQAGLGCMMCHSITRVKSSMGQGDFLLEYPELHELAATKNPVLRWLHDFSIRLNPEPHRRVFLKPFMKDQTAEFCSSCHKVHLDVPVNGYRWIRGFNEYDNWQASGVSGLGARSFYYPPKPQQCADCHMPLTDSKDDGNIKGIIHSHAFPGANTALPTANQDDAQMKLVKNFLVNGALSIDIFAISRTAPVSATAQSISEQSTTFAVGEEAELKTSGDSGGSAAPVTAPLDRTTPALRRGESARMDVVVRTRRVGHFFPGGTVDAYDTWVELKGVDDKGQTVFWSGRAEDDGHGPVEKGAHFYRSLQIDEHGNPINKRNAWATRAAVYVRLIPPGAADTIHFRLKVPPSAGSKITFTARLCYRKFSWWNTQFSYAGQFSEAPDNPHTSAGFDDRTANFNADTSTVSGKTKSIPDLPTLILAEANQVVDVLPANAPEPPPTTVTKKDDWQRWNDYGIGLLLQGDLKGAAAAFTKVTEADPTNPDGWVNIGRVAVQEGDMNRARVVLEKALKLSPNLARAHFFYARVLRTDGDYDGALQQLQQVLAQYPKDRVVRNEAGRVLFLQRKYSDAIAQLNEAIAIDPEDLQANYNLMLCYRGLKDNARAAEFEKRYMRFKADESSQALTGNYRRTHPEDNNERQSIHEHTSIPLQAMETARAKSRTPVQSGQN